MPYVSDVDLPGMRRRSGKGDRDALVLQTCRQMPTLVEKILQKVTALESFVTTLEQSNQQLVALVQEQRQEMRTLREDALTQRGPLSYADVTRTTQVKHTDTTLLVGALLRDVHADKTNDRNPIKIRRLSGASFDEIGSMIDDAATEDHLKQIIILAGTHEMTEDVPTENIQVDFKALLRKAQAVTSEITVSSVLPVIKGNAINLGRLIEVNDQLKSTCDEMDVKFVDNDTNFTFRNGTVEFTTLNRDGTHTFIPKRHWSTDDECVFAKATATGYARSPNSGSRPGYARRQYDQ